MSETYLPELREQLRAVTLAGAVTPRPRRARHRRATAASILAAAASAAIAFIAGAGSDPHATANGVRSDGTVLQEQFAVFGQPSQASEAGNPFSATAVPRLSDPFSGTGDLIVNDASVQHVAIAGHDVWLGADAHKVCAAATAGSEDPTRVACARPAQIVDDGLFTWGTSAPGDASAASSLLAGLVPDGVATVTIVLNDGTRVQASVRENVVVTQLPGQPDSVEFRGIDNVQHSAKL